MHSFCLAFLISWFMQSFCLAFLQQLMKLLTRPMLTVPNSPDMISCLLSFSGRLVATSKQVSRISSYLFLNQTLGMLYCSESFFMARTSISFSAFKQFISLRTQVIFPILDCCSLNTCWIFSLSLSLRARASPSAALFERKFLKKLAILLKSMDFWLLLSKFMTDLKAAIGAW